jgi:hypothetical protein
MVTARALGLFSSDPERSHVALHELRTVLSLPEDADAVGIGSCVDASVLLTRKPSLPSDATLHGLVGPLKGRAAVVQVRVRDELRPQGASPSNLGPWRSKQFACAVAGGPTDADQAGETREALLAELPDFLRRSVRGQSEAEAFFFHVLKALHDAGELERRPPSAKAVRDAVLATVERSGANPRLVVMGTGHGIVQVAHETPCALLTMEGLDTEAADALDPTLADSSLSRERLRRFRAAFTIGGTDAVLEGSSALSERIVGRDLPASSAIEIGREFEARVL